MDEIKFPDHIPKDAAVGTFAGGCFWCIESAFEGLEGVYDGISGYSGGDEDDASYMLVARGMTDHRETVQVFYDPTKVNYEDLCNTFWQYIDPTDANGQFADRGHQYTTAIFYHDEEQRKIAEQTKQELIDSGKFNKPIVTEIIPYENFFKGEQRHQNFHQQEPSYYERYKEGSGRGPFLRDTWGE